MCAIVSSCSLHIKKDLIQNFVDSVSVAVPGSEQIETEWQACVDAEREAVGIIA